MLFLEGQNSQARGTVVGPGPPGTYVKNHGPMAWAEAGEVIDTWPLDKPRRFLAAAGAHGRPGYVHRMAL